jgi:integrase
MFSTLARILAWACNRGLIRTNPCTKVGRLYHGTRVDKIWSEEDLAAFLRTAPPNLALAAQLAISTGQRQGDLLRAGWTAYDGSTIKLRQRKTGVHVSIPVAAVLKQALDATPRRSPLILTNADGRPFSESGFRTAWRAAAKRAGIQGLTFHDLRGTAVVALARAGCTEAEIYAITGHQPSDVQAILTVHYLPRDAEVAANAIAKLDRYRGDQNGDKILPTASPTASKILTLKP